MSAQGFADPQGQAMLFRRACEVELNAARVAQLKAIQLGCDNCLQ